MRILTLYELFGYENCLDTILVLLRMYNPISINNNVINLRKILSI